MNLTPNALEIPGNEEKANLIVSMVCAVLSIFVLSYFIMVRTGFIEDVDHEWTYNWMLGCAVFLMVAVAAYTFSDHKAMWVRYLLMASIVFTSLIISVIMGSNYLIFVLPVILCILYYNKVFDVIVAISCGLFMLSEPFLSYQANMVNLNYVTLIADEGSAVTILDWGMESIVLQLIEYTIPCVILFISVSMLSIWLTDSGLKNIVRYNETAIREAAVNKEMAIASDIQNGMLPENILDNDVFSVSAQMLPARTVGGDFYDFFKVDDTHVAIVIADVSGKGMPASLFMASAKSAIRSNLANGLQPDMVMKKTNLVLCDSNREKMFVTAWLGIIDLEDGRLSYVNAGHNPPFIIRGGNTEKLSDPPNFILGRKKRVDYKEHRTTLQEGDILFLYTDGVTEAVGPDGSMYGESRLEDVLVRARGTTGDVLDSVDSDVRAFVNGVERSDDMTIVVFGMDRYLKEDLNFSDFTLDRGSFNDVMDHIRAELSSQGCPENVIKDIEVCSSEILANIDMYAYEGKGGELGIAVSVADRKAKVVFRDKGPEYNPLLKDNPDIEMRIKDHKVGGFGLFIVRKMMDEVTYSRENDYNILTIKRGY